MGNKLTIKGMTTIEGMTFTDIEGGFGDGQKAMLAKDIAEIHSKDLKAINQAINMNRARFKDNIDIVDLKSVNLIDPLLELNIMTKQAIANSNNIYLLSERGYAKLLKILEDDTAWEQYEKLVDGYFNMRNGIKSFCENLSPELQAIIIHDKKIQAVENRVGVLENTMTVDYGQQLQLKNTVDETVINVLGGKDSSAYGNRNVSKKIFCAAWRDYKKHFNVASYRDTPVAKFENAKTYLSNWMPDYNLLLTIKEVNSGTAM